MVWFRQFWGLLEPQKVLIGERPAGHGDGYERQEAQQPIESERRLHGTTIQNKSENVVLEITERFVLEITEGNGHGSAALQKI
jgi:hypothetical protein